MNRRLAVFITVLSAMPAAVFAQATATGTLTGRVVDASGAVLPGVTITVRSDEALGQGSAVTDAQGIYRLANLQPAAYEARAELEGFRTVVHKITVRVGTTLTLDFTLPVGALVYSATQGARFDVLTGDFPLNAAAPRVILSNGRSVADPFFNPPYPRARTRGVDMLSADNAHIVNFRLQKMFSRPDGRRLELAGDVFNLFNSNAAFDFVSKDARASTFGRKTSYVPARVGQMGIRVVF